MAFFNFPTVCTTALSDQKLGFPFSFCIDKNSPHPIYQQLVSAVTFAIREGYLKKGQIMPSINFLSTYYEVSRSTIEKAYNELRDKALLGSHPGKGFFIIDEGSDSYRRILFMFNVFETYQKTIFKAFSQILGPDVIIEMAIYNRDPVCFERILHEKKDGYSHYLIVPEFLGDSTEAHRMISRLPKHKVVLLYNQQG